MARKVRNPKIDTPSARTALKRRREPYWTPLTKGKALGYRKGKKGGTWIARYRDDAGKQHYGSVGAADDAQDADGVRTLTHAQAQEKAREWFSDKARALLEDEGQQGKYTVRNAVDDYVSWSEKHRKAAHEVRCAADAHIIPTLGNIEVAKLTTRRIEKWHERLADTPARLRTRKGDKQRYREGADDPDQQRQRRVTANRILTILKAALNRAFNDGFVSSNRAWARAKPFRGVTAARVRYLTDSEIKRLVNASAEPFRSLITGAILTGARYGELAALQASDFDARGGTVHVRQSKAGQARHVVLTDEGKAFFERATAGKAGEDLIFLKAGGQPWNRSDQGRPMLRTCAAARISPAAGFHVLRHTYASRLVMSAVPLSVVAAQLGHRDTRMVDRHYGLLAPSYVADAVRAGFGTLGIVEDDSVTQLRAPKKKHGRLAPGAARHLAVVEDGTRKQ